MKKGSYSIVMNGVDSCSGFCAYCSAAAAMKYSMGFRYGSDEELIKSLKDTDNKSYSEFRADFNALEKALDNDIKMRYGSSKIDKCHFDVWGADPVTCFSALQEVVEFLEDYGKSRNIIVDIHSSTNGLPLIRDDICDYLKEHNVHIQLSHDGLGQWLRTKDYDPLDMPNLRMMIKEGYLDWINCTLSFWNWSLLDNWRYFTDKLKEMFPDVYDDNKYASDKDDYVFKHLFIKLNHIYNSDYDIKVKNMNGLYNGVPYDSLKGAEVGNLSIINRPDLAEKYSMPQLAHVLDDYIAEYDKLYHICKVAPQTNPYYKPFMNYIIGQGQRWNELPHNDSRHKKAGACHSFQMNKNKDSSLGYPFTFVIDTLGKYSECNLIDSDHHVLNPTAEQPEYCKGCKYEFQRECNGCGSMTYPKKCEYLYRWCQWLESIHNEDKWQRRK